MSYPPSGLKPLGGLCILPKPKPPPGFSTAGGVLVSFNLKVYISILHNSDSELKSETEVQGPRNDSFFKMLFF